MEWISTDKQNTFRHIETQTLTFNVYFDCHGNNKGTMQRIQFEEEKTHGETEYNKSKIVL